MSYYEAARKVRMQAGERIEMLKEQLYESPWIPGDSTRAGHVTVNLSYHEAARKVNEQKEILHNSRWVSGEWLRAGSTKSWIEQLTFFFR